MSKPSNSHSQRERILAALKTGRRIPMPELSRIGSGKPDGFTAALNTRIHELRHDFGYDVRKVRDERVNGQRQTEYQLFAGDGEPWNESRHAGTVAGEYKPEEIAFDAEKLRTLLPTPAPVYGKKGQASLFA